jgi:limonene-1,2-epoxide hydrolase
MDFPALLQAFAKAVQANDGAGLAALFAEDGVYDDGFFGPYQGRPAIAAMLQHFHDGGRDYWWEFEAPVCDGTDGYAQWRFSYASRLAGCEGRPVLFEGMSRFTLKDGQIMLYREMFDRGLALSQLNFVPERLARIVAKAAAAQNARPESGKHLARFSR